MIGRLVLDYYNCDGKPRGERNPKWLQDEGGLVRVRLRDDVADQMGKMRQPDGEIVGRYRRRDPSPRCSRRPRLSALSNRL